MSQTVPMIDLSSDTATQPSREMRRCMADAPVGDEQRGEDPTVCELQTHAAELLGKESALFLPSATMANQIALKVHTRAGDEILCHEHSHIRLYEGGGPAIFSQCLLHPLVGVGGRFTSAQVRDAVRPDDPHYAVTRLVCVENTHNYAGGCLWTSAQLDDVADAADELGLALHLDGSRLLNASIALNIAPKVLARRFDTVTVCLSKGLGAPVGAILAGDRATMELARRWKHRFGGAMRQAGIIAAGGLFALRHNIERLRDDHTNARRLSEGLQTIAGVRLDPYPQTNIVYFDVSETGWTGLEAKARLEAHGVRASHGAGSRLRFVTHLDITDDQVNDAIERTRRALRRNTDTSALTAA